MAFHTFSRTKSPHAFSLQIPLMKLPDPALVVSDLRVTFPLESLLNLEKKLRKSEKSLPAGPLRPYVTATLDLPEQTRQTWFGFTEEPEEATVAFTWRGQEMLL